MMFAPCELRLRTRVYGEGQRAQIAMSATATPPAIFVRVDNPRGGECVPVRYTTAIPGAVVLGVGVAAVVGGGVMVVLGRRAERRRADAAVQPHGLGFRVRF